MRTTVLSDPTHCTGCGACQSICPKQAIRMEPDAEGFLYPVVNSGRCISCDRCEKNCPSGRVQVRPDPQILGGQIKDRVIRQVSSSGGIFTALATRTLRLGGVVFGTILNDSLAAETVGIFSEEGLSDLRGSKYLQSLSADAIREAANLVRKGVQVLFSGTPCQVAGLYAKLDGAHPANLLTVDFVCHGTPSPGVFSAYLKTLEKIHGSRVVRFSFRDKRLGWKDFSTVAQFENGDTESGTQTTDPFLRGFLQNLYLRPSCHNCQLRYDKLPADITIADLWGADMICPERDDDSGLSMILVHSDEGASYLAACEGLDLFPIPHAGPLRRVNPSLFEPSRPHRNRERFFRSYAREGFSFDRLNRLLAPPGRLERGLDRLRRAPGALARRLHIGR